MTNRVVDYCNFAARFIGLGYLLLWPFTRPDPFSLSLLCAPRLLRWRLFCQWPQPLHLTPGLQQIGIACVGWLAVHLVLRQVVGWRRARAKRTHAALAIAARVPSARPPPRSAFARPVPKIKARSEFGLRPAPRAADDFGVSSVLSKPRAPAEPV